MQSHITSIFNSIQNQNGSKLSSLFSFSIWDDKFLESIKSFTQRNFESKLKNLISSCTPFNAKNPWNDIVLDHTKSCIYLKSKQKDIEKSFEEMKKTSKCFYGIFSSNDNNWCIPIFKLFIYQLRYIAGIADSNSNSSSYSELCIISNRSFINIVNKSKPSCLLYIINSTLALYFKIKMYQQCSKLIMNIENSEYPFSNNPISQQVTYKFYTGCISMFDFNITTATNNLSFAYENCSPKYYNNRRLILKYLIPLRLIKGSIPSNKLLEKYNLSNLYSDIIDSFKKGNISLFKKQLSEKQSIFLNLGLHLVLEKLQMLTFRNLFYRVYLILKPEKDLVLMKYFWCAVNIFQKDNPIDIDEVECMVANLIYKRYIKGYIAKKQEIIDEGKETERKIAKSAVKLDKSNPFPSLSSIFPKSSDIL